MISKKGICCYIEWVQWKSYDTSYKHTDLSPYTHIPPHTTMNTSPSQPVIQCMGEKEAEKLLVAGLRQFRLQSRAAAWAMEVIRVIRDVWGISLPFRPGRVEQ